MELGVDQCSLVAPGGNVGGIDALFAVVHHRERVLELGQNPADVVKVRGVHPVVVQHVVVATPELNRGLAAAHGVALPTQHPRWRVERLRSPDEVGERRAAQSVHAVAVDVEVAPFVELVVDQGRAELRRSLDPPLIAGTHGRGHQKRDPVAADRSDVRLHELHRRKEPAEEPQQLVERQRGAVVVVGARLPQREQVERHHPLELVSPPHLEQRRPNNPASRRSKVSVQRHHHGDTVVPAGCPRRGPELEKMVDLVELGLMKRDNDGDLRGQLRRHRRSGAVPAR